MKYEMLEQSFRMIVLNDVFQWKLIIGYLKKYIKLNYHVKSLSTIMRLKSVDQYLLRKEACGRTSMD